MANIPTFLNVPFPLPRFVMYTVKQLSLIFFAAMPSLFHELCKAVHPAIGLFFSNLLSFEREWTAWCIDTKAKKVIDAQCWSWSLQETDGTLERVTGESHEWVICRNASRWRDSRRGGEASQTQQEDGGLGEGEVPGTQGECGSWSRGYPSGAMTFGRRSLPVQRRWMERERKREGRKWILTFLSFCQFSLIGRTQTEARGLKSPSDGVIHGEQLPWLLALVGGLRERRVELKGQAESVRHTHRAVLQG